MIKSIKKVNDSIEVILDNGTKLEFSAHYSGYEDCVDLVLRVNDEIFGVVKEVFVGYDDNADKFADILDKSERIK